MKNLLFLNYNIKINRLYKKNGIIYFFYGKSKVKIIELVMEEKELHNLFDISNYLFSLKVPVDTIVLTKEGNFYFEYSKKKFILIKKNSVENINDIEYIKKFFNISFNLKNESVLDFWKNEVDTLEKELLEYNKEFSIIQMCINYYIGMAENAIQLLSNFKNDILINNDSIGHIVSYDIDNNFDLNDIFSFFKTNKMYDVSTYIKYKFLKNQLNYVEIENIFRTLPCSEYEVIYLIACLFYPTYIFDLIKRVLLNGEQEEKINYFNKKNKEYRSLIAYCINISKSKYLKQINWVDS